MTFRTLRGSMQASSSSCIASAALIPGVRSPLPIAAVRLQAGLAKPPAFSEESSAVSVRRSMDSRNMALARHAIMNFGMRSSRPRRTLHFHRCGKCHAYVCDRCFNSGSGLCYNCAPDVEVEIKAACNQGEVQGATENAVAEGVRRGSRREVGRGRQLVCPACGAETHGAKFCPECGQRLGVPGVCACRTRIPAGAKFCPECGARTSG